LIYNLSAVLKSGWRMVRGGGRGDAGSHLESES